MLHIVSWSGGKDSTATVILLKKHLKELVKKGDKVLIVFAEVMFDIKNNISGHNPEIISFMYKTAETFRSWGFEVKFLRADKDFLDFFHHIMKKSRVHPEHVGMMYGFPASGICGVKRDLKLKPIESFKKEMEGVEHIDYVGIAKDEPDRLESLYKQTNTISLLDRYGYTEAMARELCEQHGMLSPQYQLNGGKQKRDGCWFCPNAKFCEHQLIAERYPEAWARYVSLEDVPNVAYNKWNCFAKETLHERDYRIKHPYVQMTIDDWAKTLTPEEK